MRLIFVRHGEPDYDNDCLTENGHRQAENTAVRLHDEPIKEIYSSPMGRARQTAGYTAKDHELDIQILDYMHEIDWGPVKEGDKLKYDGHPWTLAYEMQSEDSEYSGSDAWRSHPYYSDNKCTAIYDMIAGKTDTFLEKFGLERKGSNYFCNKKCDDTIAMFAHGGSGACMISHIFNIPFPFVLASLPYGVCSVTIIEFDGDEENPVVPRLELFNDMGHVGKTKSEKLKFEK